MTGRHGYFASWMELVLTVGVVVVLIAAMFVGAGEYTILRNQAAQRDSADRGRAQVCRIIVGLGLPPEDICLSPQVTRYYNPADPPRTAAASTSLETQEAVCALATRLNVNTPSCKAP